MNAVQLKYEGFVYSGAALCLKPNLIGQCLKA